MDAVTVEIGFPVSADFYFGPENRFTHEQWETLREPLRAPSLPTYVPPPGRGEARYLLTRSLENATDELVRYYADVLRLAAKHGRKPLHERHYFTLEPILYSPGGDFELRYFTSEHWETAALALRALEDPRDGVLDDLRDEHWGLEVVGAGEWLYLRAGDPDAEPEEELECVWCDRAAVVRQIGPLRERTRRIRAALGAAFEVDLWSLRWLHAAWGVAGRSWMDGLDAFDAAPGAAPKG